MDFGFVYKQHTGKNATWEGREGPRYAVDYVIWLEDQLEKYVYPGKCMCTTNPRRYNVITKTVCEKCGKEV